jgi:hypothetical protein
MLKQVHKSQAKIMKARKGNWDHKKEAMNEEKRNLEYIIHHMFQAKNANNNKLKRIKLICEE